MQRSALCRSRRELSDAYLLAKFGFGTAENEPCKVCPIDFARSSGAAVQQRASDHQSREPARTTTAFRSRVMPRECLAGSREASRNPGSLAILQFLNSATCCQLGILMKEQHRCGDRAKIKLETLGAEFPIGPISKQRAACPNHCARGRSPASDNPVLPQPG